MILTDEIRTGMYRDLFKPSQLISGLEDSSCNFARGYYTIGRSYLNEFMDILRQMVQLCDSLQGFMLIQGIGGGCGSGFTSLVMEQLSINYCKNTKMQFSILPSSHQSSAIVEPYNVVLTSKVCIEATDLCFQHDNMSIYDVFHNKLQVSNPTFSGINRLLAQIFSSITVSVRYTNALNNDIDQIATNLVPYPRLHYPIDIYSPLCTHKDGVHYLCTVAEITKDVFNFKNKLLDFDYIGENFLSCCLQYRGDVYPSEINRAISEIKKMEQVIFVDWCPTGFKIGINRHPPISPKNSFLFNAEKSLLLLCNHTCFHHKIGNINSKFDILFHKRSFVHWFVGEGMEEGEFTDSREELAFLQEDYKCLSSKDDMEDLIIAENMASVNKEKGKSTMNKEVSDNLPIKNIETTKYESLVAIGQSESSSKSSIHRLKSPSAENQKAELSEIDESESESDTVKEKQKSVKEDESTESDISTI